MPGYYKLNEDHSITEVHDVQEWSKSFYISSRRVAYDSVGDITISTVFLGLDHSFGGGAPLLFETMAFNMPDGDEPQYRYHTWDEALLGHLHLVASIKAKYPTYIHISTAQPKETIEENDEAFRKIDI